MMNGHDFFGSTVDESWVDSTITAFNNLQCDITNKRETRWGRKNRKNTKNKSDRSDKTKIDRFIPIRDEHKFDAQQTYQQQQDNDQKKSNQNINNNNDQELVDDDKNEEENENNNDNQHKILSFQSKAPEAPDGYISNLRTLYTYNGHNETKSKKVNKTERVLDAPDLMDDFYLNLLDWSANDIVAIGLGSRCYFWNSENGEINLLNDYGGDIYICSVAFNHNGQYIAIGTSNNIVTLYDTSTCKTLRKLYGHSSRIGSLSWNHSILSTGSADSTIRNNDVRQKNYHISTFGDNEDDIEQEICGLKWNNNINGKLLASGSNDNKLCIWRLQERTEQHGPYYQFTDSLSAVKAMSWCLWNNNLLATGGGSSDRKIRIYDINNNTGNLLSQCDTQSQVCSIQWNPFEKELLSSHGFTKNQLSIWKYPLLNKTHDLCGHTSRVLHTALSPDGTRVCSAAADETLRFWKVFEDNNNQNNTNDYDSYYSSSTHSNNKNNNNKSGINGLNLRIR
mmetsp:Transcript_73565/g.66196  ORF Transcript_73565/g.66196 Transcript_73565/m.66196 type:complete len:508 (-) Transcript_73565:135-1658(-)